MQTKLLIKGKFTAGKGEDEKILDPATGAPAFTGVVQATALAPTGVLAETFAKAALLAGPEGAEARLPYGGVIVESAGGSGDPMTGAATFTSFAGPEICRYRISRGTSPCGSASSRRVSPSA